MLHIAIATVTKTQIPVEKSSISVNQELFVSERINSNLNGGNLNKKLHFKFCFDIQSLEEQGCFFTTFGAFFLPFREHRNT